ncbi:selenium cofactor biosynthesis protein YqeC [Clostridium sp. ZS2-4]|uniref:selenium cofactor biosynthesis protein YqeC n=1 Tax=Clostridium sp. ZS2-4 TaxID=2987703 RepID=UPI00227B265F|nr:selenium cofactor biosynthesis protein YqeC [Clostridium sp. ZS2-4]MCY6353786.1 selenium cofactor biosynthesis protein YqeC [Clostridium sp. ZS2-4]
MELSSYVGLKQKDIISIVGAGGKTSFMFQLAQDIKKNKSKVLLTTTTKIYVPQKEQYDFICIGEKEFSKYADIDKKGIYVYGTKVNLENKIIGLGEKYLDKLVSKFDYVLIEADGAKKKPIKGWNDNEPVIYEGTTKTIGILDIQTVGMKICESNVHRSEQFCKITNSNQGENITLEHLLNVIFHQQGLFKNAKGEKILFINKADDSYYLNQAEQLKNEINKCCPKFLNKIVSGSIKNIAKQGVEILL